MVSFCIFHFIASAVVVFYIKENYHNRIINIKNWVNRGSDWEDVFNGYARKAISDAREVNKKTIFLIGSSVTYGFPYKKDLTFGALIGDQLSDYQVYNIGIVGAGMDAITDFGTCSLFGSYIPDVLVAEIPLINSITSINSTSNLEKRVCTRSHLMDKGLWGIVLPRPKGIGWGPLLWDEVVGADHKWIKKAVPAGFFVDQEEFHKIEKEYIFVLRRYLESISVMGKKVFVFVSPISTIEIEPETGVRQAVEYQISLTNEICLEYTSLICLNTFEFTRRKDLYGNLTHFNPEGHRLFASWLGKNIREHVGN